jgi:transmembrane sensor
MRPGDAPGLLNPGIREEAAEWFIAFCEEEVDARVCQQFNDWLRRSPEHVRAYLRISAFWEDAGDLSKHAHHRADEIVQRAIAESNVVPFSEELKDQASDRPARAGRDWRHSRWHESARPRRSVLVSLLVAGFACAGVLIWLLMDRMVVYSTAPGERRTLTLTDGSTVELNARSRIRVAYSSTGRDVDLLEGQALFKVARSPSRPFVVHSGDSSVRAVGTQFDVNRSHGAMIVTVVEGRVAVTNGRQLDRQNGVASPTAGPAGSAEVFVEAGERVVARARTLNTPEPVNASAATAWTEGKLVLESVPLRQVLEEFNRYLPRPLVVDDAQLLDTRISGVFSVTESPQFVEFLHQRFGTASQEQDGSIRITRP